MSADTQTQTIAEPQRVVSVDIFRGITMLVMIFVNDVAGVKSLPWWTYHLPADVNGMTYVDVVFPVFLFIVGLSIPLAIRRRLEKDGSQRRRARSPESEGTSGPAPDISDAIGKERVDAGVVSSQRATAGYLNSPQARSLPLAAPIGSSPRRRLPNSQERVFGELRLWGHILARAVSLAVLGIIIANSGKVDSDLTGIPERLWGVLAFVGAMLFWNVYPSDNRRRTLFATLKWAGLVVLVILVAVFRRRAPDGSAAWLDFSYWEILGLIGCAYLSACLLYVPTRKSKWAPVLLLVGLTAMNVFGKLGWLKFLRNLPPYVWPFETGALASIVMAGIVASIIFLDRDFAQSFQKKAWWAFGYATLLFAGGWLLTPFGISKIRATPTWCLYCAGISTLILLAIYWLADVKGHSRWAAFVRPAGANALLTYLLPDIFYATTGLYHLGGSMGQGLPGVLKSAMFTAAMLGCAAVLTRWKIRLQL